MICTDLHSGVPVVDPGEISVNDPFSSMTPQELYDLVCRANEREEEALRLISQPFEKLITTLAEENANERCSPDYLADEGCIALLRAIQRSAENRNEYFPELAERLIRGIIADAVDPVHNEVRLSEEMALRYGDLVSRYDRLWEETGSLPSPDAFGLSPDVSAEDLEKMILHMRRCLEMLRPLSETEPDPFRDGSDYDAETFDLSDSSVLCSLKEQIAYNPDLDKLSERARRVLGLRFGLDEDLPKDPGTIGRIIGITTYRVYQIEIKALRRLGIRARESGLDKWRT